MANRKICVRKDELAEDVDWLAFSLEIFSRAFQLLKDFSEIFESRVGKCCRIDHDKMQLFGALNVVLVVIKSKRPGLFRDICGCARQEQHEDISGCIIREIHKVFVNLQKCCVIENVVREVKDALGIIENIPTFSTSVQLKMLSYLLQEIMKKLISCRETSADQLTRAQSTWILRLVNNFIRDWSIENSRCRFCDHATSKVAQRWGTYCCEILQLYYDVWEEWALQQSISNAYKQEPSVIRSSSARAYTWGFSKPEDVRAVDDGSNVNGRWTTGIPLDVFDIDRTVKHRDPDSGRIVTCRRVVGSPLRKTEAESYRAAASWLGDKFDGIGDSDLTMAACRWIDGELGKGARSRFNIDKDPGSPIAADRREKRDDVPHGLNAVAPGDPDTDEEGTAVRKMRKIKSDMTPAPDRKRDRPLRSVTEGNGTDRSPREMVGNRSRSRDSRLREPEDYHPDAESPKGKKGARGARKSRGERMSPDRSRMMKSRGETDRSERDEEPSSGKKKSKKSQNVESIREEPGRSKVKKLGQRDEEEYDEDDDRADVKTPRGKKKSKGNQNVESNREEPGRSKVKKLGRRDEEEYDENDDRTDVKTPRGKKKSKGSQNVESNSEEPGRSKVKKLGQRDEEEYDEDDDRTDVKTPRGKKKSKGSQNVESIREQTGRSKVNKLGRKDEEEYDENDDRSDVKTSRGKKKPERSQNLETIDEEHKGDMRRKQLSGRGREIEDTDDEEEARQSEGGKMKKRKNAVEDKEDVSESVGARERRKEKTDALDRRVAGGGSHFDEEESVPKRDGKRRAQWSDDEADSDVMKRGGKIRGATARDKSTPNSEGQSKKETSEAGTKGRREYDSSKADDNYSKINGPRSRQRTTKAPDLSETVKGARDGQIPLVKIPITSIANSASLSGLLNPQRLTEARYQIIINREHLGALGMFERRRLIEYQLSNQSFVKHGWTVMPTPKTMKKVIHYQAKPAKPHLNWFERRKYEGKIYYDDGVTVFVKFHPDGSADVFYPNGVLAIEFCKPGNEKYGMYTVFRPGGKDCVGVERKSQIVGVFDTVGNGAVFDEDAATRLSYNQIGGIWGDNPSGSPLVWKWDVAEKNLPVETVYQEKSTTCIEKFLHRSLTSTGSGKAPSSSPLSSRNKEKKVVEQKPVVAVHDSGEEVTSGLPDKYSKDNHMRKMICMKLTDNISLRIANRREICLKFFAARRNIRIELGTVLNFNKEVASHFVDTSLNTALLKCKFDDLLKSPVEPEDSLRGLVERLREVRKSARQRKFMIRKYKPYLPLRKAVPNRCRL